MSINTSNLVTTQSGQAELAEVHSVNAALFSDHREISVEIVFPMMAISNKTEEEIAAIQSTTVNSIKSELCWANVDICQVQKYAVEDVLKRDFTIGGLFEVKNDISGVRTIILFARTLVRDNRSNRKKYEDSSRSAVDIVESEYGYMEKIVPYAYTLVLDSSGAYSTEGITIGASRYGRSRHRFYFNYIIDNNSGIADNITVDDNVYPYSDGYLSKTGFELGLERYEKAIEGYKEEYEKYANGHRSYYNNVEEAIKYSANGNRFVIKTFETDEIDLSEIDMQAEYMPSSRHGWQNWYPDEDALMSPSYKGYSAKVYGDPYPGQDAQRYKTAGGVVFEFKDVRPVDIYDSNGNINVEYLPVGFKFFMFNRSPVPFVTTSEQPVNFSSDSLYHAVRCRVVIKRRNLVTKEWEDWLSSGFEMTGEYANDDRGIYPICPSIGRIGVFENTNTSVRPENKRFTMSILTQDVEVSNGVSTGDYTFSSNAVFRKITRNEQLQFDITTVKKFVTDEYYYVAPSSSEGSISGRMMPAFEPNFAGGYAFYEATRQPASTRYSIKVYEFGRLFDCGEMETEGVTPIYETQSVTNTPFGSTAVVSDLPVLKNRMQSNYAGLNFLFVKNINTPITSSPYDETPAVTSGQTYSARIMNDARLHNARVYVISYDTVSYINLYKITDVEVLAFINNKFYRTQSTVEDLFSEDLTEEQQNSITQMDVVSVSAMPDGNLCILWNVKFSELVENEYHYSTKQISTGVKVNVLYRYTSISDIEGDTGILPETVG